MVRFNRTTEYGLIALRHMSQKARGSVGSGSTLEVSSAREIADYYGLPFEITAKTLQRLKDGGLIRSAQGARGGYLLDKRMSDVTMADFLELMEGPQGVVPCCLDFWGDLPAAPQATATPACNYEKRCEIKDVMGTLNSRVHQFLAAIRLSEITDVSSRTSPPRESYLSIAGEEP